MLIVGLSGGIGTGKSAVTHFLAKYDVDITDADIVAREVVQPGEPALQSIAEHFGQDIIDSSGNLDRRQLRQIIFADESERIWLEKLLHPLIQKRIKEQLNAATSEYAILVSPLLLETTQHQLVDVIVVVDASRSNQIQRACARDGSDEAQIKAIVASQLDRESRIEKADIVIDNNGSVSELESQLNTLHMRLIDMAKKHIYSSSS